MKRVKKLKIDGRAFDPDKFWSNSSHEPVLVSYHQDLIAYYKELLLKEMEQEWRNAVKRGVFDK